jgi:hypothetical protein
MSISPGDFANIPGISQNDAKMFKDAYDAVTIAEKWEDLKITYTESFMFSPPPFINSITSNMKMMIHHSGCSFGVTMRAIEYIAKNGWDSFVNSYRS